MKVTIKDSYFVLKRGSELYTEKETSPEAGYWT